MSTHGPCAAATAALARLFGPPKTHILSTIPRFVIRELFRDGRTVDGILGGFSTSFVDLYSWKVEPPIGVPTTIREQRLLEYAVDLPASASEPGTLAALGGYSRVELTFGQVWAVVRASDRKGPYVSYHRDIDGSLGPVFWNWFQGGLIVDASLSIARPKEKCPWAPGWRFLSRGDAVPTTGGDRTFVDDRMLRAA